MKISLTRVYTWIASLGLLLQGGSTLAALLIPEVDRALPGLLRETQMVISHSILHLVSGLIGLATLRFGGHRGAWLFALGFGTFYVALGIAGGLSGQPLGLGLKPFDHPFHVVLGGAGLLAVGIEYLWTRKGRRSHA